MDLPPIINKRAKELSVALGLQHPFEINPDRLQDFHVIKLHDIVQGAGINLREPPADSFQRNNQEEHSVFGRVPQRDLIIPNRKGPCLFALQSLQQQGFEVAFYMLSLTIYFRTQIKKSP